MFEWDVGNESELLKHGVTPVEAEEAYADARALDRARLRTWWRTARSHYRPNPARRGSDRRLHTPRRRDPHYHRLPDSRPTTPQYLEGR